MSGAGKPGDVFDVAGANIRDTAKWLMAAFAGTAAAMVGTSPLTKLGSLDQPHFLIAIASGLIGLAASLIAIYITLNILARKRLFIGDILQDPELVEAIEKYGTDLLPPRYNTLEKFLNERRKILDDLASGESAKVAAAEPSYEPARAVTTRLRAFANFERLRLDFDACRKWLFLLAVAAALSFGCFGVASSAT